jgi:hypothetical protein
VVVLGLSPDGDDDFAKARKAAELAKLRAEAAEAANRATEAANRRGNGDENTKATLEADAAAEAAAASKRKATLERRRI